jgi:hypothetical protein
MCTLLWEGCSTQGMVISKLQVSYCCASVIGKPAIMEVAHGTHCLLEITILIFQEAVQCHLHLER